MSYEVTKTPCLFANMKSARHGRRQAERKKRSELRLVEEKRGRGRREARQWLRQHGLGPLDPEQITMQAWYMYPTLHSFHWRNAVWTTIAAAWATHLAPAEIEDSRQADFETIDRALVATIRYMEGRRARNPQDQNHDGELTELWMEASRALSPIDDHPEVAKVADACMVEGLDWTD